MIQVVLLALFVIGHVSAQSELLEDPGIQATAANQCASDRAWYFRADYLWNNTEEFFDSRCQVFFELPTDAVPGLTRGNQTNINKATIPPIPSVTGGSPVYPNSAAVVDMNTPCRAALWQPFTVTTTGASVTLSLQLWVRSNENIQQVLAPGSEIPTATLLQYLRAPDGLLITTNTFPPIREETNQIRIDILLPDGTRSFYDRAFSIDPTHIQGQVEIPGFRDGYITPAEGTNRQWIEINADISDIVSTPGEYALRFASAQSRVGVSWGVSDVHITTTGGTKKRNAREIREMYSFEEEVPEKIVGEVTHKSGKTLRKSK